MASTIAFIVSGLIVGFLVGLTGVGGGSLMAPLLVFLFGYAPGAAVGTDLFFASGTKVAGTLVHGQHHSVNWKVVRLLVLGSFPASALTLLACWLTNSKGTEHSAIMFLLGTLIVLSGMQTLGMVRLRPRLSEKRDYGERFPWVTVGCGAVLGCLVTLTSIGAGALGMVMLRLLYPKTLNARSMVGSDLAHAIPLTLLAGIGYFALGKVEFAPLGLLLIGSIPGVIVGSSLTYRLNEKLMCLLLGLLLFVVGIKVLLATTH